MKVILFGATGMLGRGTLLECLESADVESILVIGRAGCGETHPKLRELIHKDLYEYETIAEELKGYDACFFCLGVSSAGMNEADYTRITYDLTLAAAKKLAQVNPGMTFNFISGASTDSTEQKGPMWARVKGKTENALLKLGFKAVYLFRPGYIHPMKGVRSRTPLYNVGIVIAKPLYPIANLFFKDSLTTTVKVGQAMINVVKRGYTKQILDPIDINALAAPAP